MLAALPLILCAQSLQGMLESAPDDRSSGHVPEAGVDSLADRPTGDLAGFPGPAFNPALSVLPTGEGDLSQLWFHDGRWWGVMIDAATNEFHIWALDPARRAWVDTGTYVDDRPLVRPDVLWAGNHLYVIAGGRRSLPVARPPPHPISATTRSTAAGRSIRSSRSSSPHAAWATR